MMVVTQWPLTADGGCQFAHKLLMIMLMTNSGYSGTVVAHWALMDVLQSTGVGEKRQQRANMVTRGD